MRVPVFSDIEAVRRVAVPLRWIGGEVDATPLLRLFGPAEVIGLGEPSHGDAESVQLKFSILRAVAAKQAHTMIAWERSVGNMRHLASILALEGKIPHRSRRWIYPWVSQEVDEVFRWVHETNQERPGSVTLCGVDMDGPGPAEVLDGLAEGVGAAGAAALKVLRTKVAEARRAAPDAGLCHSVRAAIDDLLTTDPTLSPADRLLVEAIRQWTDFGLLWLGADADQARAADVDAAGFRDQCMARNLIVQRRMHEPDTVLFSAHNGHVSRAPSMAGGHLATASQFAYLAIGVAFGGGQFLAGTATTEGGFDPKLTVFDAEAPPEGTLESLLGQVSGAPFAVDLRPFRGADHPLGREMRLREVSLAGGAPQFDLHRVPADTYDLLIWYDRLTPARILRETGDFW